MPKIKIPEKPPSSKKIKNIKPEKFFDLFQDDQIQAFIKKANREYLYWEKFKQKFPSDVTDPWVGWLILKISRSTLARYIPIQDKGGRRFSYILQDEILKSLTYLSEIAGGQISLDAPVVNAQSRERYLVQSLMEEAISSSILEGAATTRLRGKEMLLSGKKPTSHADKMIYNNYITISKIGKFKNQHLSIDLLKELHSSLTSGTLEDPSACGRFINETDHPRDVMDDYGTVLHVPPPAREVESRIESLIQFANEDDPDEYIPPIIKAIILHFALSYIHPFIDGNGRTARAVFYWYMLKKGYWLTEYVSISKYLLNAPSKYAKAFLYTEQDDSDLTYFLLHQIDVLCKAFKDLTSYLKNKQREVREFSEAIRSFPDLSSRQKIFLQSALEKPDSPFSIQQHKNYNGITYETARKDLLDLEKKKLLQKYKKGNAFYFILSSDIDKQLGLSKNL
ncbi:MAG: Fic family protein [Flavobacteriaceae bacterium]|nr:Fic family protein [Flavobacteriaceae bacterium]